MDASNNEIIKLNGLQNIFQKIRLMEALDESSDE